ncbi:MAG: SDR family oxidoreductase [Acidimicrobiia bacterium]|nr:SDR family oxidoreductase [Acidimicrobiia bacterium]
MDLSDHVAIVTGAGSGIGAATARRLLDGGAEVGLLGRRIESLRQVAGDHGARALVRSLDVSDPLDVAGAIGEIVATLGRPTILVNSAGVSSAVPLGDLDPATWNETIAINLSGSFYVSREAAKVMDSGASIVNLGSELSLFGAALYVHYCASKFGVVGMTKAMARELAPLGIRVNAVCPGPVEGPMMDADLESYPDPAAARATEIERIPLKRFATAEEVANLILFAALGASYTTGSCFSLDGGSTA